MPNSRKYWLPDHAGAASQVPKMMGAPAARGRQRGFFDFSFPELALTFGVALMVLGPKKLPGLVQQVGRWVGRARHMARQFREQLEQEVNSINEVKPVPRNVAPEVGPAAPGTEPAPDPLTTAAGSEAATVAESTTAAAPTGTEPEVITEAAGNDVHPEAQIYFALNGTEPTVVAQDPYAPSVGADDPRATTEQSPTPGGQAEGEASHEAAAPKAVQSSQPTSVEVVFPHDHG